MNNFSMAVGITEFIKMLRNSIFLYTESETNQSLLYFVHSYIKKNSNAGAVSTTFIPVLEHGNLQSFKWF